jgi:hypothetical protein
MVPDVLGEVDRGHPPGPELAHQDVAPGERGLQAVERVGHGEPGRGTPALYRAWSGG